MISGHAGFLRLAYNAFFHRGEGRTGRVKHGWRQTRFSLPFAVFLTYIIAPHWYLVSWCTVYSIHQSCKKLCIFCASDFGYHTCFHL